jgi:hypothetical protein
MLRKYEIEIFSIRKEARNWENNRSIPCQSSIRPKYVWPSVGRSSRILISALKGIPHALLQKQPCAHKQEDE